MKLSFGSTAHGAGRIVPRMLMSTLFDEQKIIDSMKGIIIKSNSKDVIIHEASQAYKDVDRVVNILEKLGINKKVAKSVPLCVIK